MTYNFGIITSTGGISFHDISRVVYSLIGKHEKIGASQSSEEDFERLLRRFSI